MINVQNLVYHFFKSNTWFQVDNRYVLVSIKWYIYSVSIEYNIFSYIYFMIIFNANTVWYMIVYTDTMCMIPEWLYVNLISLLGNSVMPLALFTGNKKKRKLCSSYYALISKIDNSPYCGELFFVSFVPSSSLSCYAPVDTPTHIFIANFIFSASSRN